MSINADEMITQIEQAITKLLNGDAVVSLTTTNPDGQRESAEYSIASMGELLTLKDRYESLNSRVNYVEMEIVP